ncbi:MAG: hypothetical protein O3C43_00105 [Verrucomicrobia bacterium]|nr:hypothetical protein [Verrucomicrobiota bacterium]
MKINIKKRKQKAVAAWHQDFRNPDALPDIKVIRTRFFVNVVAIVVPLFVAILWVQQELSLSSIRDDIGKLEDEQAALDSSNTELVSLSRDFLKESSKVESLEKYYHNLFPLSDYLEAIAVQVPVDMVISSMDLKKSNRVDGDDVVDTWESRISGYVVQEGQSAVSHVNKFVEDLRKEELLAAHLNEAFLDNLARDQITDTLNFVVSITMSEGTQSEGSDEK